VAFVGRGQTLIRLVQGVVVEVLRQPSCFDDSDTVGQTATQVSLSPLVHHLGLYRRAVERVPMRSLQLRHRILIHHFQFFTAFLIAPVGFDYAIPV